jgi:hypothetical protein
MLLRVRYGAERPAGGAEADRPPRCTVGLPEGATESESG